MTMIEPTEAQKEAGNYAKDHVRVQGLEVSIENRKGSQRSGTGKDGKSWSVKMPAHYGYIRGTVGSDGDHVDCYLGPHVKAPNVYVVDQVDADSGKFDEHKCLIGFSSKEQALGTYRKGFSDGRGGDRIGAVSEMTVPHFKEWLKEYGRVARASGGRVQAFAEGGTPAFDPDAYLGEFNPDAYLKKETPPTPSVGEYALKAAKDAVKPFTSYPETYLKMARESRAEFERGLGQLAKPESPWDIAKGVGNVALGGLGWATSPINAGLRTIVGQPLEEHTGIPKEYSELVAGLATPGIGLTRLPKSPVPTLPPPPPSIAGVTLSEGQSTRSLPLIQREQAALRGVPALGAAAHARAAEFGVQQAGQVAGSHANVARALDPFGQVIAETPHEAGRLVSEGIRSAERSAKAGVTAAYDYAKSLPGEVHAGTFEGIAPKIKNMLSMRPEPIIIDELTPHANKALSYLEKTVAQLRIPNRASLSHDTVLPEILTGENAHITLRGLDQWRKNLSTIRRDAEDAARRGGSATDARAARSVLDAFDDHVEAVLKSDAFRGDPRVVQAWLDARAAHADYKSTFAKQGGRDPVGNVVQKVIGNRVNDPAIPSDVANFAFGASGVVPNSTNVGVARRFREILGPSSPEWSAVKQGLWARLTEMPTGDPRGHKAIADRITTFLANPEAASVYYTPWQQNVMREYAELQRHLVVPQAGANWSNTGAANVFQKISGQIGMIVGGVMGHYAGHKVGLPFPVGEAIGAAAAKIPAKLDQAAEARRIARQMPVLAAQAQAYAKAYAKAQQAPSTLTERAMRTTAIQLDHTLRKFGISLESLPPLQGPIPSRAEEDRPI